MRATVALLCTLGWMATTTADTPDDAAVWKVLRPAMLAFQAGGSRDAFLAQCRALRHDHPHTMYTTELSSLVTAMDDDAKLTVPTLSPTASPDDAARYWIYELRDVAGHQISDPGYPSVFGAYVGGAPNAADQLVAIGAPAIPRLVDALADDTPTRTIAWQRSFYPVYFVLRRRDLALKVLERITGARFYEEGATFMHFYLDTAERQRAVVDNVRAWWQRSRGASQAQMIRNQLELMHANATLGQYERVGMLELLGQIEGPESVVPELRQMYAVDATGLNSAVATTIDELDPQTRVRAVLARFWADQSRDGDYTTLYKYGDARVYAEIARRFVRTGKLDPGSWTPGQQAHEAAQFGKNWAIPILAQLLLQTDMTGARWENNGSQPFSVADEAVEEFSRLTAMDFGYAATATEADRLGAIAKARQWWEHGGDSAMQQKIAEPHAVPVGDLLRSDDELAATARAIGDARTRTDTIAHLGDARSFVVQRALVRVLAGSHDEAERRAILAALHLAFWQLPTLVEVLAAPGDAQTRALAADRMIEVLRKSTSQARVELRYYAIARARLVANDASTPADVRRAAERVVASWAPLGEHPTSSP